MGDPRLNSLHLEAVRRQEYRRARDVLLQSRGNQTIFAERALGGTAPSGQTCLQGGRDQPPLNLEYWLVENDCVYPLKVGINTLGRSSENDVVVRDAYVSRRHCAILVHAGDGCELHDTASKNGTFLNGKQLSGPHRLRSGDEIRVCERRFVFMTKDEPHGTADHSPTLMED
jgi:pSer/pThr/pTyr-binding forkhead associated (FHA) protein